MGNDVNVTDGGVWNDETANACAGAIVYTSQAFIRSNGSIQCFVFSDCNFK